MITREDYNNYRYLRSAHGAALAAQVYPNIDAALYPVGRTFDFLAWAEKKLNSRGKFKNCWDVEDWLINRYSGKNSIWAISN